MLEELSSGHQDVPSVADMFIGFVQTKAIILPGVESVDEYVVVIKVVMDATQVAAAGRESS